MADTRPGQPITVVPAGSHRNNTYPYSIKEDTVKRLRCQFTVRPVTREEEALPSQYFEVNKT